MAVGQAGEESRPRFSEKAVDFISIGCFFLCTRSLASFCIISHTPHYKVTYVEWIDVFQAL